MVSGIRIWPADGRNFRRKWPNERRGNGIKWKISTVLIGCSQIRDSIGGRLVKRTEFVRIYGSRSRQSPGKETLK